MHLSHFPADFLTDFLAALPAALGAMLPSWSKYVLVSSSLFVLMTVIEKIAAWRMGEGIYDARNTRASVGILLGHYLISMMTICFVVMPVFHFLHKIAPWQIGPRASDPLSAYLTLPFLALIFLDDLVYYVHHWCAHNVRFLWAIHHAHHSSNVYNILVAARNSWFDINIVLFWFPLVLLGYDPAVVMAQHGLSMFFNIFIHTKLVGKLGFLESFVMTPSNHRVHHATNPQYYGKNLGNTFVIWDKLFGTYAREVDEVVFESEPALKHEPVVDTATFGMRQLMRSRQEPKYTRKVQS